VEETKMGLESVLYKCDKGVDLKQLRLKPWAVASEVMGRFKKTNQIHRWFLENIQNGVDDSRFYLVDEYQFKKLYKLCTTVESNPERAEELLPTLKGFDIGSAKYDAVYFENLSKVLIILGYINNTFDFEKNELVYSSSH
jgi:hypothetical protein